MNLTREQFQAVLIEHLEKNGIVISELAKKIGENRSTISHWVREGIKNDSARERVIKNHPEIFLGGEVACKPSADPAKFRTNQDLLVLIKVEQARFTIASLSCLLQWFLFEASAEDRNSFRDSLGESWKNFLELTRAMTGEKAFEVTKEEGRLSWLQQQQ